MSIYSSKTVYVEYFTQNTQLCLCSQIMYGHLTQCSVAHICVFIY